MSYKHL